MSPTVTLDVLIAALTGPELLERSEAGTVFRAPVIDVGSGTVFGGELLGQTVAVASHIERDMPVRSVSAVFPRAVRDTGHIDFESSTLSRGSSYATQRIEVRQPDRSGALTAAFSAHVISHRPAAGIEHQQSMPTDVCTPDDARPVTMGLVPWDTRLVGTTDLDDRSAQKNEYRLWHRVPATLPDDVMIHQALLAYLTDLTLIGTALLPHEGWSQLDAHVALRTSVIAHQIVFHRPFRIDEWLLLSQSSPRASSGTAFGAGHVFTQQGELVASITQEAMVRVAPPPTA